MLAALLPALVAAPFTHAAPAPATALPPVTLDTAAGPLTTGALRGRWTWVYMGYANCPDVCPNTLTWLATEYRRLAHPDRVQVVFVSVDPLRDKPKGLAEYAHFFDASFIGATGDRPALDRLAGALGARYQVPANADPKQPYAVAHTNTVYVIDPEGRVVGGYEPTGDALAADFAALDAPPPKPAPAAPANRPVVAWCDPNQPDWLMDRVRTQGSGTSLIPAASPMRMWALAVGDWRWMFHGSALAGYNRQDGTRGDLTWAGENWQMAMGSGQVGPGILDLRLMTSLEALTVPAGGTPQLFQEGETYKFNPLIDHQHPHDLFMEVAARYSWRVDKQTDVFLYGGPAGEPALGPVAFMHRPSAADNPWAPLAHHLQDSTHISYGVATAGVKRGPVQVEGSVFNGREPDEYRYNFDLAPMDSFSGRVSWAIDDHWVAQVSHGHLHNPERLHPGDVERTTASILSVLDTPVGPLSSQLVWGENLEAHPPLDGLLARQSYGLENQLDAWGSWHLYDRLEILDRDGLPPDVPLNHTLHRIEAFTLGGVKDLGISDRFNLGVGADVTLYGLDQVLMDTYGYNPVSFRVYVRLQPPAMGHPGAGGMQMGPG